MKIQTSIYALIKLMGDADQMVVSHATSTLLEYGEVIIPDLLQLEEDCFEYPEHIANIELILHQIRFEKLKKDLVKWVNSNDKDLLKGIYIVSTYQFPELEWEGFKNQIDRIIKRCDLQINPYQTGFEKVEALNGVFFDEFDFVNVKKIINQPFEIYINSVLDTSEGTDFSLGLIYSLIAQSLDLPIYGVVTPINRIPFVLAYKDTLGTLLELNWNEYNDEVLFYIGIGMKGMIIEPNHLKETYFGSGFQPNERYFSPSSHTEIMIKYLQEIKQSYSNYAHYRYKLGEIEEIEELLQLAHRS